jgi:hypothetical protein
MTYKLPEIYPSEVKGNYIGETQYNIPHGFGEIEDDKGNHCSGEWQNGKFHGCGTMKYSDSSKYDGQWNMDRKEGYCKKDFPIDNPNYKKHYSSYEGECIPDVNGKNSLAHGNGKLIFHFPNNHHRIQKFKCICEGNCYTNESNKKFFFCYKCCYFVFETIFNNGEPNANGNFIIFDRKSNLSIANYYGDCFDGEGVLTFSDGSTFNLVFGVSLIIFPQ